jgi:fucose 4-O-acetylase-like acetyltransferase
VENTVKTRSQNFEALKGVCIYFVVCIHFVYQFFTPEEKPIAFEAYNYITSFAVPLFLVLSGYFFAKKYLSSGKPVGIDTLISSFKTLFFRILIPYYIFVVILSCYNYAVGVPVFWKHFLFIDSNSHGLYYLIIHVYSFLWCMLVVYFLQEKVSTKYHVLLVSVSGFVFFPIVFANSGVSSVVFRQLPLIAFFTSGIPLYFIQKYVRENILNYEYKTAFYSFLGVMALTIIVYFLRKYLGPFPVFSSAPPSVWKLLYCALVFLIAINFLSIPTVSRVFERLMFVSFGTNSLYIFLIHPYFIKAFVPIIESVVSSMNLSVNNNSFLLPVLAVSYFVTVLSQRSFGLLPEKIRNIF